MIRTAWVFEIRDLINQKKVFGVYLDDLIKRETPSNGIPLLLDRTVTYLRDHLHVEVSSFFHSFHSLTNFISIHSIQSQLYFMSQFTSCHRHPSVVLFRERIEFTSFGSSSKWKSNTL